MAGVMARCPIQPIDTDYYFIFLYYSNKRYLFERDFNVWANRCLLFQIIICLFCFYSCYVFWFFLNYIVQHNGQPLLFYCAL